MALLAKGDVEEQYHPASGESPESIQANTQALEAKKPARRGPGEPPAPVVSLPGQTPSPTGVETPHPHPPLDSSQRIEEQGHDLIIP